MTSTSSWTAAEASFRGLAQAGVNDSMPASRKARAIIFAPRHGHPTRLAISTLIFFSGISLLFSVYSVPSVLKKPFLALHDKSSDAVFNDRNVEIDQQAECMTRQPE